MKKGIAIILSAILMVSLAACGGGDAGSANSLGGSEPETLADVAQGVQETFEAMQESGVVSWKTLEPDTSRPLATNDNRYPNVTVITTAVPTTLGPFTTDIGARVSMGYTVYETLLIQTGIQEYANNLAKNYYYEDDSTVIFELYDYIYDTDGNNYHRLRRGV